MNSSCRWSTDWKQHWCGSGSLRSVCEGRAPAKTPENSRCRRRKGKNLIVHGEEADVQGRPGFGWTLHLKLDRVFDARLIACPKCQAAFPVTLQTPQQIYERIELPPIKPDVTEVRLFGGRCACCGERVSVAVPAGLERFAIRSVDCRLGGLPALHTRDRHGTTGHADG